MPREHRYFVYILSSKSRRIYTGVTGNLFRRVMRHKGGPSSGIYPALQDSRLVFYQEFQ
jgi:putative endonuclease